MKPGKTFGGSSLFEVHNDPGFILADAVDYFNYAYFEILPLSFLWTEQVVQSLAVGMTVGIYGLAANHSGEEERAFILGRMDACLSVTAIFGFALAAPTFEFFTGWSSGFRVPYMDNSVQTC